MTEYEKAIIDRLDSMVEVLIDIANTAARMDADPEYDEAEPQCYLDGTLIE